MDRLLANANCSLSVGTSSWKQQFEEVLAPSRFYVNENEEDENQGFI